MGRQSAAPVVTATGHGKIGIATEIITDGAPVVTAAGRIEASEVDALLDADASPGGKNRGRPRSAVTQADRAREMNVGLRSVERASFIRRRGVPELSALCYGGQLDLVPAEWIARWPVELQLEIIQGKRPEDLPRLVRFIRMAIEEEDQLGILEEPERQSLAAAGIIKARK